QLGNNNAYCHDTPLTWFDWELTEKHSDLLRFCREMIAFRRRHHALRYPLHVGSRGAERYLEISWHGTTAWQPDWSGDSHTLAFLLRATDGEETPEDALYVAMNMHWEAHSFGLPNPPANKRWHVAVNTGMPSPADISPAGEEPPVDDARYVIAED